VLLGAPSRCDHPHATGGCSYGLSAMALRVPVLGPERAAGAVLLQGGVVSFILKKLIIIARPLAPRGKAKFPPESIPRDQAKWPCAISV
jgi:hypothetical protein